MFAKSRKQLRRREGGNDSTWIMMIMSLTPVSSSDKDIGGVPPMQSSYSADLKRYGICMEERSVHCKSVGRNPKRHCAGY